jgi:hypothetical protein
MRSPITLYAVFMIVTSISCVVGNIAMAHPGSGVVVDNQGQVYFFHTAYGMWNIDADGALSQFDGPGWHWLALDRNGRFAEQRWPRVREHMRPGVIRYGDAELRSIGSPATLVGASSFPITIGPEGALYYPEPTPDEQLHIKRLKPGEKSTVHAAIPVVNEIAPDYKPWKALWIHGLAAGLDGSIYYTEKEAVRKIDPAGTVTMLADNIDIPDCEGHDRGGVMLRGIDVADDGTVYVASTACGAILKIPPGGEVEFALLRTEADESWSATGVAVHGGDVYILEIWYAEMDRPDSWMPRVRKLSANGDVTVLATVTELPE